MYIENMKYKNLGPISDISISPNFDMHGNPKPLIFVGENGSGKSTVLSNIVDSFYEMAELSFRNAKHTNETGTAYYKTISNLQIKTGEKYLFSYIKFTDNVEYIYKAGDINADLLRKHSGYKGSFSELPFEENFKHIEGLNKKDTRSLFDNNVLLCYFGPERYSKPSWLGDMYYDDIATHYYVEPRINGVLDCSISVIDPGKDNLRWLLDVIADSRTDVLFKDSEVLADHTNLEYLRGMTVSRDNIEKVMSSIIGEEIYFGLNLRKDWGGRFNIIRKKDNTVVAPTLDSLSTGQLALFDIFCTIIRYADYKNINNSIQLNEITGIVVIDEIDLHLHSKFQKEIIPKLMKLFPKIQFVITTHSPLFLLGMEGEYGHDGFDIYQMPNATMVSVEEFSEFNRAYDYFCCTVTYHENLIEEIKKNKDRPLIITEGSTDWKHIEAAYNHLRREEKYEELFKDFDFDLFRYEPQNSNASSNIMTEMGNGTLCEICEALAKIPQERKVIFLADRDHDKTTKKLLGDNVNFKTWGNNVFSLVLPVPEQRKETPKISIEHYYSDKEIKTESEENGIKRRLFIGNEFDKRGLSANLGLICGNKNICGPDSIHIIDGTENQRVTKITLDDGINYALSKAKFAENVLKSEGEFANFDFSNFIELFRILKDIVNV